MKWKDRDQRGLRGIVALYAIRVGEQERLSFRISGAFPSANPLELGEYLALQVAYSTTDMSYTYALRWVRAVSGARDHERRYRAQSHETWRGRLSRLQGFLIRVRGVLLPKINGG